MPSRRTIIAAVLAVVPLGLVVLNLQAVHQAPQTQQRIQPHEENFIQKTLEAIRGEERRSGEEIAQAAQDLTNAEAIVERLERAGNELANLFAEREASETSRDAAEAVAETERQRINPDAPWEREVKVRPDGRSAPTSTRFRVCPATRRATTTPWNTATRPYASRRTSSSGRS